MGKGICLNPLESQHPTFKCFYKPRTLYNRVQPTIPACPGQPQAYHQKPSLPNNPLVSNNQNTQSLYLIDTFLGHLPGPCRGQVSERLWNSALWSTSLRSISLQLQTILRITTLWHWAIFIIFWVSFSFNSCKIWFLEMIAWNYKHPVQSGKLALGSCCYRLLLTAETKWFPWLLVFHILM